jgi:hypothetical protein
MASTEATAPDPEGGSEDVEIADEERLARQIFYKISFLNGVLSANSLLQFLGNRNADGSFDESLFMRSLTSDQDIYDAGCQAAASQNNRRRETRERKGLEPADPVPGQDRRYYCGFTHARAADLKLKGDNYNVELMAIEENGMKGHVSIFLRPNPGVDKLHRNDLTEAGALLARRFGDPHAWICRNDVGDAEHPVAKFGPNVLVMVDSAA